MRSRRRFRWWRRRARRRWSFPCPRPQWPRRRSSGDRSGRRARRGPPVRPLDRFYTRVQADQVEIGPRFSVNSEFERFPSYRDPGQDLDGIGQYLYPGRFSTPKLD